MRAKEADRSVVILSSKEQRTLFFYREDCKDCQKVFPMVYRHEISHKDVLFVNLKQTKNRHYITEYQLKTVPTLITKNQRYEGTNKRKIKHLLND